MTDYKLSDFLGIAGATIGIIIAGGILMGNMSAQYIAIFERFRALTGEYRGNSSSDLRRGSLRRQIASYGRQILHLNFATLFVSLAVLAFLATVSVASLSVIYPHVLVLRLIGTCGLFLGLALITIAVVLQVMETIEQRRAIRHEVADFNDLPSYEETLRE